MTPTRRQNPPPSTSSAVPPRTPPPRPVAPTPRTLPPRAVASTQAEPDDPLPRGRPRDRGADQRILLAAFEQLVRVGYGGLSMEAVATQAGVAKTTVYRRYPTKRDLVVAALREETPFAPLPADMPARDALDRLVRQVTTVLIESGAVRILGSLLVEEQREPGLLDVFRQRILGPRRAIILEMLQRGIERGEIRPDVEPTVVMEMVAGAVFGHHVILGQATTDAWIEALVDHVWTAIAAR